MNHSLKNFSLLLLVISNCFCQIKPGIRQIALAHSDFSYTSDAFTVFNNPAGIALSSNRKIDLFYSPAPFDVKELSNAFAAYIEPSSAGNFSAGFSIYGFELYKETKFGLGYGNFITENFAIGSSIMYQNVSIKNYGSKGIFILNVGAIADINEQIGFGFIVENINRASISESSNQIPTVFWVGIHLKYIENFVFSAAVRKEIDFNPSLRLGVEFAPFEFLFIRIGMHNEPDIFSGGFGIIYNIFEVGYAVTSHPDLGITHQFGMEICFNK